MAKILYLVAKDQYFCSHRLDLASYMRTLGHEVAVATNCSWQLLVITLAIALQS